VLSAKNIMKNGTGFFGVSKRIANSQKRGLVAKLSYSRVLME